MIMIGPLVFECCFNLFNDLFGTSLNYNKMPNVNETQYSL
jgi:hypothetical protein